MKKKKKKKRKREENKIYICERCKALEPYENTVMEMNGENFGKINLEIKATSVQDFEDKVKTLISGIDLLKKAYPYMNLDIRADSLWE